MDKRIKKLVKEILTKESCGCGCNTCHVKTEKTAVSLNENKSSPEILSEGLKYHISRNLPLNEQLYRAGSENYFNLWAEARSLYSRGILEINNPDDLELIRETNLGEFGIIYEIEIGDKVKASKEYGGLSGEVVDIRGSFIVVKTKEGPKSYHESDLKVLNKEGKKVPLDFPMLENEYKLLKEGTYEHALYELDKAGLTGKDADYGGMIATAVLELIKTFSNQGHSGFSASMVREIFNKLSNFETLTEITSDPKEWEDRTEISDGQILFQNKRNPAIFSEDGGKTWWHVDDKIIKESIKYALNSYKTLLIESESKKKNPPLNKPKRGGSKKFYVYVRDPKTKKIKKVSFGGTTGLSVKINDPKARQAFAKRHNCAQKKDKTKASYWSCRIGKYWKQLGGDKNFSGFW
jgi:hypothetical protein